MKRGRFSICDGVHKSAVLRVEAVWRRSAPLVGRWMAIPFNVIHFIGHRLDSMRCLDHSIWERILPRFPIILLDIRRFDLLETVSGRFPGILPRSWSEFFLMSLPIFVKSCEFPYGAVLMSFTTSTGMLLDVIFDMLFGRFFRDFRDSTVFNSM